MSELILWIVPCQQSRFIVSLAGGTSREFYLLCFAHGQSIGLGQMGRNFYARELTQGKPPKVAAERS